ncbi:MAG: DUF11 domain-containing protein [Phycisphaeraceae bacterium]|nr:DUF11 domain-containing protein [Phycisphaeraceae bacterium]
MRTTFLSRLTMCGLAAGLALAGGCHTQQQVREPEPKPEPVADCNYVPAVPAGMVMNSLAYPTGEVVTSAVVLHEIRPREARANQPYSYEVHVTNRTRGRLQNVVVKADNMQNLSVSQSSPQGNKGSDGSMTWVVGEMAPCETKVIKLTGTASKTGVSGNCLTVSYNNTLCATTAIVEPALVVTKTVTPDATVCDMIVARYEVKNTGTGIAEGVVVKDTLPAGLTTEAGSTMVQLDAGSLAAGQSKFATVNLKAAKPGRYESAASASATGGLNAESAKAGTNVKQTALAISSKCTGKAFVGRDITFEFTVKNTSDTPSTNTTVTATMPAGASFVSATMGGGMGGGGVMWNVGTLNAGESKVVAFTARPSAIGSYKSTATANATCATQVATECTSGIEGIPAILVEVVDNPDPIEVGGETTYTIIVTNQGSATDTNVKVVCTLPDGLAFVAAGGASNGSSQGAQVVFAPIASLAPKATVTFTVRAKAVKAAGDVRFLTDVTSDQFKTPIREMESTNLYQ